MPSETRFTATRQVEPYSPSNPETEQSSRGDKCFPGDLVGIIQALGDVDISVDNRDLLAALNSKALHIGAFLAGALLVPLLRRASRRRAQVFAIASRLAVHGNRAASPGSTAPGKGTNTLLCDVFRDVVAVVVGVHALEVHVLSLLVVFGPDSEAPCVRTHERHGRVGENGRNLHFESGWGWIMKCSAREKV